MFHINNNNNSGGGNPGGFIPDQTIIAEVEAEINRRIAAKDSFTAFDISRAVQANGVQERHRNMKVIVHDMYERGDMTGYTRTQVTLPTGEQPFLYHPADAMIPNHFATASNTTANSTTTPNPALDTASMFGQGQRPPAQSVGQLDGENRLRLPIGMLRKAGFLPGDTIYISRDEANKTVSLSAAPANAPAIRPTRTYRLSENGIRLTVGAVFASVALRFRLIVTNHHRIEIHPQ